MIGWTLAALVVLSLVSIALGVLLAPRRSAEQYGIAIEDPRALAFIRAMGVRDAVIGGLLGLMALARARDMLAWGMCVTASIAVTDLLLVTADRRITGCRTTSRPRLDAARLLHAGGAVGLLVTAAVLLAGY
jgi:hypothetical protein